MARGRKRKAQEPESPTVETQAPPEGPPPLEEVAEAVAAGEAEPGPEMPPEEVAQLQPGDVADLGGVSRGSSPVALSRRERLDQERVLRDFSYHPPKADQVPRYTALRDEGKAMAKMILDYCPTSRERSLALTNLEQAVMWANAAIARNEA
jgi:hypothetical protein